MTREELLTHIEDNKQALSGWDAIMVMCATPGWASLLQMISRKRKVALEAVSEELDERKLRQAQGRLQVYDFVLRLQKSAIEGKKASLDQINEARRLLGVEDEVPASVT